MCWHSQLCKPVLAGINNDSSDWEEESDGDDNGREYGDELAFYED